jgi:hypothetical protein
MLLLLIADPIEDVGENRAGHVHEHGRVGAEHQLVDRPLHRRRRRHTTDVLVETNAEPFALPPRVQRFLERFRQGHDMGVGVECRGVAVALGERLGDRPLGQSSRFGKHLSHRFAVQVAERLVGEHLVQAQRFKEVELQVAHVALVVAHA